MLRLLFTSQARDDEESTEKPSEWHRVLRQALKDLCSTGLLCLEEGISFFEIVSSRHKREFLELKESPDTQPLPLTCHDKKTSFKALA
jgi:hypothetical protein